MSQMSINPTTDIFLLCQTSLHSLEEGRQQQIAIQTFKMVNNFSPPYLRGLITPQKFTRIHRNYVITLKYLFTIELDTEQIHFLFLAPGTIYKGEIRTLSDLLYFRKVIAAGLYTAVD